MGIEKDQNLLFLELLVFLKKKIALVVPSTEGKLIRAQIQTITKMLIIRSQKLADIQKPEMNILKTTVLRNGYSENNTKRTPRSRNLKWEEAEDESIAEVFLPYVKGTTQKIRKGTAEIQDENNIQRHSGKSTTFDPAQK